MATVSIPKELYDKLIKLGHEPGPYVSQAAEEKLAKGNGTKPAPKGG